MLREASGNAFFFSVYEYVRYHMHIQLKSASSDHKNLIDVGVGIVSGGLGGIAVCIFTFHSLAFFFKTHLHILITLVLSNCDFSCTLLSVLVCRFAFGCGEDYNSDITG